MFDWSGYLSLAKELIETEDEAYYRAAISRAYYASYKIANELVDSAYGMASSGQGTGHGSHEACWNSFTTISQFKKDKNMSIIMTKGFRLKKMRIKADYTTDATIKKVDAVKAIEYSEEIIGNINNYKAK